MARKIALEEHFLVEGFAAMGRTEGSGPAAAFRRQAAERLPDIDALRLDAMDKAGIEIAVLSLFQPGIQGERDTATAIRKAKAVNDTRAERIARHATRFRGFAAVPMQDPREAADELERAVKELGFKGALINGHTRGVYLDEARYLPFWGRVAALDVPIYLHPANPMTIPAVFAGYPSLAQAMFGWAAEAGGHALRLVLSGLFDRFPSLTVILGHMGEALPFYLWRIDSRFKITEPKVALRHMPSEYIRRNIAVTTAGAFSPEPLRCAIDTMGLDRVLFSVDYPLEDSDEAARFIETAPLSEAEREAVCFRNAERVLKL
ncbi:MAG TPA: amidohydrolase family protein [Chloroflexota bacterium]|nr:amidohydrolase family protein [Chloroflexota bacterium]